MTIFRLIVFLLIQLCKTEAIHLPIEPTSFYLITRGDPISVTEIGQKIDKTDGFKRTDLSRPDPTVLLLHGLGGSLNNTFNMIIAEALLERTGYTVIIADYESAAKGPDYISAAKNMEKVGKDVAKFLLWAQEVGSIALSSTTLIGFSLGAHVAGIAGYNIKESSGYLDKIIGLDPPAPWFTGVSDELKLDKTDAGHVAVIHTASGYLSLTDQIGHVDFYPNGGTETQPMCEFSKLSSIGVLVTVVCSHMAAYRYLAESILRPGFIATKCDSWEDYEAGVCSRNQKAYMGFDMDPNIQGTFYLRTNKEPPFGSPLIYDDVKKPLNLTEPEILQESEEDLTNYHFYTHIQSGVSNNAPRKHISAIITVFYCLSALLCK